MESLRTIVALITSIIMAVEIPGHGEELKGIVTALIMESDIEIPAWIIPMIPYLIDAIVSLLNKQGVFKTKGGNVK